MCKTQFWKLRIEGLKKNMPKPVSNRAVDNSTVGFTQEFLSHLQWIAHSLHIQEYAGDYHRK